jgi:short-subunit dehydrogenase
MDNVAGKWALVTGASSGFGVHFATLLAEQKANLVLAARRIEPMEQLAKQLRQRHNVSVVVEGIDLSASGAAAELKARLDQREITVDILVNNAGYGLYGSFVEKPLQKITEMLQLNLIALTELTHIFAKDMVARRSGHILLVASLLGYQAAPGYAAYAATKAYVLTFGEALHAELKYSGVGVTVVSPGPTSTSFGDVAGQRDTPVIRMLMMKPLPVARIGIRAMLRRKMSIVTGLFNKLIVFSFRFAPRRVQGLVMHKATSGWGHSK